MVLGDYKEAVACPCCKGSEFSDEDGRCGLVPYDADMSLTCLYEDCICWGGPDRECESCWLDRK